MNKKYKHKISIIMTALLITSICTTGTNRIISAKEKLKNQTLLKNVNLTESLMNKTYPPNEVGPYIITFTGPIDEFMKNQVRNLGVELDDYLPEFSFLAKMTSDIADKVTKLDCVKGVTVYQPAFNVPSGLMKRMLTNSTDDKQFRIVTFNNSNSIKEKIQELGGEILESNDNELNVKLSDINVQKLLNFNEIKYIELIVEDVLFNDIAKPYMGVDKINSIGYNGNGQVVGICDTGIDSGVNDSSMHKDFQGRIDKIISLGRPTADDPNGHGTHVAGSVLGNGAMSNGQYKGTAPNARLVFQSVLDKRGKLTGIPSNVNQLFSQAWAEGARIHTNSWGAPSSGEYTTRSRQVDEYVWNNDMIVLFAAGNEGCDKYWKEKIYNTIGSPGTAKNCITVGASENNRPDMDRHGDNPNEIAIFSSRGKCKDGRIKPDIVAPGTWILSTRSSLAPDNSFWGNFNKDYAYMGGTSMATPLTAGAVAVAREYMQKEWKHTPTPAMMKAAIINGGVDMGYGLPSQDQGWGRINLENSLIKNNYKYEDQTNKLSTGQKQQYKYNVKSADIPFKTTLVWTDFPGSVGASKALVNDLDVKITSPSGKVYCGNDFIGATDDEIDRLNNVENVFIQNPEVGDYLIEINAYNVPQGPQPFALFASGSFGNSDEQHDLILPECNVISPKNNDKVSGNVSIQVSATDKSGIQRVEVYVDGLKISEDNTMPYEVNWDSKNVKDGSLHEIQAIAYDNVGNAGKSSVVTVVSNNNINVAPQCSIISPKNNEKVSAIVNIKADATSDSGIQKVEFYVDGSKISEDNIMPYEVNWDSKNVKDGSLHEIQVIAYDNMSNIGKSSIITVSVENSISDKSPECTISLPENNAKVKGTVSIEANAIDDQEITKVEFYVDDIKISEDTTNPYVASWDSTISKNGSNHQIHALAYDNKGNVGKSNIITVIANNEDDVNKEVLKITSIKNNDKVSGNVTIDVEENTSKYIAYVGVYVDDKILKFDFSSPFSVNWDSTSAKNGSTHTIQAIAFDYSGYEVGRSNIITISVESISSDVPGKKQ